MAKGKPHSAPQGGATSGKLIVFEGIDGSGKTTQVKLLLNYLEKQKIPFSDFSFPRYEKPWGKMVRRYLIGEFGKTGDVNPYLASVLYAGDRLDASNEIKKDLAGGKIAVCDRYVASNIAHQAVKLGTRHSALSTFINWVERFEYEENKIPREDLVILLSINPKVSQKLMKNRKRDLHEKDVNYLTKVEKVFEGLAKEKKNWVGVENIKNGRLRKPEEIHREILQVLKLSKIL